MYATTHDARKDAATLSPQIRQHDTGRAGEQIMQSVTSQLPAPSSTAAVLCCVTASARVFVDTNALFLSRSRFTVNNNEQDEDMIEFVRSELNSSRRLRFADCRCRKRGVRAPCRCGAAAPCSLSRQHLFSASSDKSRSHGKTHYIITSASAAAISRCLLLVKQRTILR